jgi:macrolide transport system ATP-binding/permease protein
LEAGNITKYYADKKILDIKKLCIYSGDKIGLIGLNGSGKTTLLNILSGRTKPDSGSVDRRADISYIKQFGDDEINEIDTKIMNKFGVAGKYVKDKISGGEQMRIKIAAALGNQSRLIFADEPTSNLDLRGVELLDKKIK